MSQWTLQDVLALSDERDLFQARLLAAERRGYERGLEDGRQQGYLRREGEERAAWAVVRRRMTRPGPAFSDLERKRWGPGGREHFGDPRPGDYLGGLVSR